MQTLQGGLSWNIADRVVRPIINGSSDMNAEMYATIQGIVWKRQNIGIKPQKPKIPKDRIEAFLNKLVHEWEGEDER